MIEELYFFWSSLSHGSIYFSELIRIILFHSPALKQQPKPYFSKQLSYHHSYFSWNHIRKIHYLEAEYGDSMIWWNKYKNLMTKVASNSLSILILLLFSVCLVALVVSDSLRPYGPWLARLLCPWDSPGKNIGVGYHFLLHGFFLTQGLNLHLLHCRRIFILFYFILFYHWALAYEIQASKRRLSKFNRTEVTQE